MSRRLLMIVSPNGLIHHGHILAAHVFLALDLDDPLPTFGAETFVKAGIVPRVELDRPGVRLASGGAGHFDALAEAARRFAHIAKQRNLCDSFRRYVRRFEKRGEFGAFVSWRWKSHCAFAIGVSCLHSFISPCV